MKKFYTFIAVACVAMTASAASFEKSSKTIDATRTVNTTVENAQPVAKLPEGIIKGLRTRADELPDVSGTYVFSGDYCMEQGGTPAVECDQFKLEPRGNSGVARGNYTLTGFMGSKQEMNVKVGVVSVPVSDTESQDVMALQIPSKTAYDTNGRTMMVFGYGEKGPTVYSNPILFGITEDGRLIYLWEGIAVLNSEGRGFWCVDVEANKVNTTIDTVEIEENETTKVEEEVPYSYETYVELKDNALNFYGFCGLSPIITFEIDKAKSTATATDQYAGSIPADQTGSQYYDMTLVDWKTKDAVVTASLANVGEKCEMTVTCPEGWAAVVPNVGYLLRATSTKITMNFNIPGLGAGVNGIMVDEDADAPVEYFNLTGVKVENPSNGLYIRRQGHNVSKVLVK